MSSFLELLETLPNISNDSNFNTLKINKKRQSQSSEKTNEKSKLHNVTSFDKEKWFKSNKDNTYYEGSIEKVDYLQDVNFWNFLIFI
jgi:hypothetical protein